MAATKKYTPKCDECGATMVTKGYTHVTRVGTIKVKDTTDHVPQCPKGHGPELDDKLIEGYERRAAAIVLREAPNLEGAAIKFARKSMGLTQPQLGALVGCAVETLSRWENGAPMPQEFRLALICLLESVERGVPLDDILKVLRTGRSSVHELTVVDTSKRKAS